MGTAGLDYLQRLHTADPEHMSASRDQVGGLTLLFSSSATVKLERLAAVWSLPC